MPRQERFTHGSPPDIGIAIGAPGAPDGAVTTGPCSPDDEDRADALDATLALLGLPIAVAWRAAALANMKVIGEAAQLVLEFPLADEDEPAPVFVP